jgi:hypothetical protein
MNNPKEIEKLIEKVASSKEKMLDLSSDEDLSVAIMNLVSIEEHLFFTGAKTGKSQYYDLLNEARKIRGELLKKIVKDPEGEVWCISKHLLAASMRLIEVGTKAQDRGKKDEAENLFGKAYQLYSLFWGLNLKLSQTSSLKADIENDNNKKMAELKKINDNQLNVHDKEGTDFMGKLSSIVTKLINCCKE